jgi:hypothetical protein
MTESPLITIPSIRGIISGTFEGWADNGRKSNAERTINVNEKLTFLINSIYL